MAIVSIRIGEVTHDLACRDGGEDRLREAGALIAAHWDVARRAAGPAGASRAMLLAALMVADELIDAREGAALDAPEAALIDRLAQRVESLAAALEEDSADA